MIDDADDGGVDGAVLQARRHAGRAAADDQHGFAEAGIDRVDGDEVAAFGLAVRIDRPRDEQLVADEPLVLARGDDGPDDLGEQQERESLSPGPALLCRRLADRQRVFEVGVRPRDDVHRHELATRRAAAAPASVAAFTAATSPRTIAVT